MTVNSDGCQALHGSTSSASLANLSEAVGGAQESLSGGVQKERDIIVA